MTTTRATHPIPEGETSSETASETRGERVRLPTYEQLTRTYHVSPFYANAMIAAGLATNFGPDPAESEQAANDDE